MVSTEPIPIQDFAELAFVQERATKKVIKSKHELGLLFDPFFNPSLCNSDLELSTVYCW
jgi:hypothetical protein